jgi:hypothetical protein
LTLPLLLVSAVAVVEAILLGVLLLHRPVQPVVIATPPTVNAGSATTAPPTATPPARTTAAAAAAAAAPHGRVGQRVESGGFGITVEKQINEPQTYKDQVTIGANERYLALLVLVENNTGGNAQLFPSQFILKDDQGFTYDQLGIHGTMPVLEWQTLGNRQSVRGHVDFVVPKSAKGLTLVYGDTSREGSQPVQIDLGK